MIDFSALGQIFAEDLFATLNSVSFNEKLLASPLVKQAVAQPCAYCGTPRRFQRFYVLSEVYGPYTCRSRTVCQVLRPRIKLRPEDIRVNRHDRRRAGIPRPSRTSSSEDTAAWLAAVRAAYKVGFML